MSISAAQYKVRATTEHQEQVALVERCKLEQHRYPELQMLVAIPNAGKRTKYAGGRMKAEGLAVGFPDLMLLVARRGYNGLFVELKTATGKLSNEQHHWLLQLETHGYFACVRRGQDECWKTILWYLGYRDSI